MATFAANCNLFVTYLAFFWPSATEPMIRIGIIAVVIILLTVVNIAGIRQSAVLTNIFTIGFVVFYGYRIYRKTFSS